jgi:protein TonB
MMRFVLPAIALSLGLHAGLLALAGGPDAVEHGAESAVSSTVIVFDAQPAPAVSASADADQLAEQQPVEAEGQPAETLPETAPAKVQPKEIVEDAETEQAALKPEPVIETPVEEPQRVAETQELVQPEPEITSESVTEPALVQPVETRPFVPIPRIKPQVPAELAQKQPSTEKPARRKAKAKPVTNTKSSKKLANRTVRRKAKQRSAPKTASTGNGRKKTQSRASSAGRSGGASAGEKAAYARRVLSHIQRYKSFPSGARAGKVGLKVRISASGTLQSASVRRSSGHRVLDKAAVATARRASPYPKPPGGSSFSFTVSLRYQR